MTVFSSAHGDVASELFDHLRNRCHRSGGRLSLADLDAAERSFRLSLLSSANAPRAPAAPSGQPPFDGVGALALFLYAHISDLVAVAFVSRRHSLDRAWNKRFFCALAEFLVDYYDPAFPARAAAAHAEATATDGHPVSGINLISRASGRAAARYCLAPLIEGPAIPPAVVAVFCSRVNAVSQLGGGSQLPLQVALAEAERFFALVRQMPRLRAWLDDIPDRSALPDHADDVSVEDLPALLAAAPPSAP